jgi:hypothetical protein
MSLRMPMNNFARRCIEPCDELTLGPIYRIARR